MRPDPALAPDSAAQVVELIASPDYQAGAQTLRRLLAALLEAEPGLLADRARTVRFLLGALAYVDGAAEAAVVAEFGEGCRGIVGQILAVARRPN